MSTNPKTMKRRVEQTVCRRIEAAMKRDHAVRPVALGAELAAEFLNKAAAEPELVFAFVSIAGAELIKKFCDMPRSKWPIHSGAPSALGDLPYALEVPPTRSTANS